MKSIVWSQWRSLIACEFTHRAMAFRSKGSNTRQKHQPLMALFLLKEQLQVASPDIIPAITTIIKGNESGKSGNVNRKPGGADSYEDIAMMGHRIGMIDGMNQFRQYLGDIREILLPHGQMVITAFGDFNDVANQTPTKSDIGFSGSGFLDTEREFQNVAVLGPYFWLFYMDITTLKSKAAEACWRHDVLCEQEDGSYAMSLLLNDE
jgi:hypothetical protein